MIILHRTVTDKLWRSTAPLFCFSLQLFHFMTNKIVHHDRNDRFACTFFHCEVMISALAKDMGLQSRQKRGPKNASTPRT